MDPIVKPWYFWNMPDNPGPTARSTIPAYALYGERHAFPDILHCERITDRAVLHDWHIAPHRHPHLHQFFFIQRGAVQITVDGMTHDLAPPVMISIPRLTVHGFRFAKGTQGYVLTIPVAELSDALAADATFASPLDSWGHCPATDRIAAPFAQIQTEHRATQPGRAPILRALALLIACQMAREMTEGQQLPTLGQDQRVKAFETLVRQNYRRRWRVADYAQALSMTPTHLNRICRQGTGLSASKFVETILFQDACRQLAYTRITVAEIGYALGFDDPAYFSRAFQRRIGLSPTQYRRKLDGEPPADEIPESALISG
ncbi:MAG: AraC family transcriptional regulator [Confluentimicrobium sp.]|uniref:helix-turn-helix domain-containing protein n=1 Tax=Actibacterium sp. TaxID=1872125 RepID=UPI000C52B878|nr:helix-turn-helix domain-containing protein [Actibacterium sp.]MBC56715.1 AraC family transcriptional regulator [Actibacterium sp.]|tara:strand:- start:5888 stop:6838 length:951 start_codon:yes stop_codon:yes gene_type:complete